LKPSTTGGPISIEPRINERIRVPEVRLVGPAGEQIGILRIEDALRLALEADLDLVEVAPEAKPPVCKLMDFGKFKYEAAVKAREARKNQVNTVIKEMKLLEKHLPKTGKYQNANFKIDWQNFTSGPPVTNGMMANRIHIGMMGDYPLLVNGATGQQSKNETQLVAIIAYNAHGAGNGRACPS